jgi:hypothetical protein
MKVVQFKLLVMGLIVAMQMAVQVLLPAMEQDHLAVVLLLKHNRRKFYLHSMQLIVSCMPVILSLAMFKGLEALLV